MPEYAGQKISKKDLKAFHKDMKKIGAHKPPSEKEMNDMAKEYDKTQKEEVIVERIKIAAVTPQGRKTYRYANSPVEAQKKIQILRKRGHSSISTMEEEFAVEAKIKNCGCGKDPCETYGSKEDQLEGYGQNVSVATKTAPGAKKMGKGVSKGYSTESYKKGGYEIDGTKLTKEILTKLVNKRKKQMQSKYDKGLPRMEETDLQELSPDLHKRYMQKAGPEYRKAKERKQQTGGHQDIENAYHKDYYGRGKNTDHKKYEADHKNVDTYHKRGEGLARSKRLRDRNKPKQGELKLEAHLHELDTDTIKSAHEKRKKQEFDHSYARDSHMSKAQNAKTKEAEKTHRSFAKQRAKKADKASKGMSLANRALRRKGYQGASDYRLHPNNAQDRYDDERSGRLKENYKRQRGFKRDANWRKAAAMMINKQSKNSSVEGRKSLYLLKYLLSRTGLAK